MATEKQIQANRQNALSSTGPKSPEGKSRAARNALKHGLLSRDMVLPGESPKELKAFREAMIAELAPEGELEEFLADRVVESAWRLGRAVRLERDIIQDEFLRRIRCRAGSPGAYLGQPDPTGGRVAASTLCGSDTYDKLGRYETHIERGLYRALHELQRLQAVRTGGRVPLPLAVDVDVTGLPAEDAAPLAPRQERDENDLPGERATPLAPLCQRGEEDLSGGEAPASASPGSQQGGEGMGRTAVEPQTVAGGSV
jgi:hypothetical protein